MNVVAILPAYNEASRVAMAVRDACAWVDQVVVVDDCSHDQTVARALEAGAIVLSHPINRGQGASLQTGTEYALRVLEAQVIVHFDSDGQMRGDEIPFMIEPITSGQADIVLGSRFLKNPLRMPYTRRLVLKGGILFTWLVSGIWLSDTHCGFRALSKHAAQMICITRDRMAHASEILDLVKIHRLRYVERPVTISYSQETLQKGQSSLGAITIVKDLFKGKFFDV